MAQEGQVLSHIRNSLQEKGEGRQWAKTQSNDGLRQLGQISVLGSSIGNSKFWGRFLRETLHLAVIQEMKGVHIGNIGKEEII